MAPCRRGQDARNSGEAIEAFDDKWKRFSGDGFLAESADAAEALSFVLQVVATIIMVMKLAEIAQLIALAFEFGPGRRQGRDG
ncbi:hypothetical protein [Streptomyces sp. NPDC048650]|uniref:hypothetical protein n=1 Tax=Streptomyces sp. NPDC048650 TaxID=3365583 RepID=UPI00371B0D15